MIKWFFGGGQSTVFMKYCRIHSFRLITPPTYVIPKVHLL